MKINPNNVVGKTVMFGDGAKGSFTRLYSLHDKDSGKFLNVNMVVSGSKRSKEVNKKFITESEEFDNLHDALCSVGHEVIESKR